MTLPLFTAAGERPLCPRNNGNRHQQADQQRGPQIFLPAPDLRMPHTSPLRYAAAMPGLAIANQLSASGKPRKELNCALATAAEKANRHGPTAVATQLDEPRRKLNKLKQPSTEATAIKGSVTFKNDWLVK